jgi:general secretion pathway protein G
MNSKIKEIRRGMIGFSLLEMILVIGLIGTIFTLILGQVQRSQMQSAKETLNLRVSQISMSLMQYRSDTKSMPTTEQGLKALVENPGVPQWRGPYADENNLSDDWGNSLEYFYDSGLGNVIVSPGPKNVLGDADDIYYLNGEEISGEEAQQLRGTIGL